MRFETKMAASCTAFIGMFMLYVAFNTSTPGLKDDYVTVATTPIVAETRPEPAKTVTTEEEIEQPEPVAVATTRPAFQPFTPSNLPESARFITGEWTDDLYQRQFKLVKQLNNSNGNGDEWLRRYERGDAREEGPNDDAIIEQLKNREKCDRFQRRVPWSREDLLREFDYFHKNVYPKRPIRFNTFGMRLSHAFGCWFITKWLQPEIIIENGVHMGQSTWLLRQAAPNAVIYSHDPRTDMQYWDKNAIYHCGTPGTSKPGYNLSPFIDFADMDWGFIKDKSKTLILFDDHQSSWKRIKLAYKLGFKHLFIDDNWSPLQGDNYSAKQVCDESGGHAYRRPDFPSNLVLMCDNFHMADKFITTDEHRANREELLRMIKVYYESPPVLFVPALMEFTPFGHKPKADKSSVQYVLPRPSNKLIRGFMENTIVPPLIQTQEEFNRVGMERWEHRELVNYANFGYLELV